MCHSRGRSRTRDGMVGVSWKCETANEQGTGGVMKWKLHHIHALLFCYTSGARKLECEVSALVWLIH